MGRVRIKKRYTKYDEWRAMTGHSTAHPAVLFLRRSEVSGVDAKGLGNAIKAAVLNVLAEQKRPGGMLNG